VYGSICFSSLVSSIFHFIVPGVQLLDSNVSRSHCCFYCMFWWRVVVVSIRTMDNVRKATTNKALYTLEVVVNAPLL